MSAETTAEDHDEGPSGWVFVGDDSRWSRVLWEACSAGWSLERWTGGPAPARSVAGVLVCPGRTRVAPAGGGESGPQGLWPSWIEETTPIVLVSSTAIYTPRMGHPGMVDERPARRLRCTGATACAWQELELRAPAPRSRLTIVRAAPTPVAAGRDLFSRLLRARFAVVPAGYDPPLQILATADLAAALRTIARRPAGGVVHVVPRAPVSSKNLLRSLGIRRIALPRALQVPPRRLLRALTRVGAPDDLEYLRYPFTASGGRSNALGIRPGSSVETLRSCCDGREVPDADDYGWDPAYCDRMSRTVFGFLHDVWFRVEVEGLERVPREGGAVLCGPHRGNQPFDAMLLMHLLRTRRGRMPRFLVHPALLKFPLVASHITKIGGVSASQEHAARLLEKGWIVGVMPEGVRGAFTEFRHRHRLGSFGRSDFVRIALRNGVPLLPFVTVGPAESMPIWRLLDWGWWKKTTGWPGFPLGPVFPLQPIPLPTRWHTLFLEPMHVEREHPPEAAADPAVVREIAAEFRRRVQGALDALVARRRSLWRGSIFDRAGEA